MIVNTRPLELSDNLIKISNSEKIQIRHIHLSSIHPITDSAQTKLWTKKLLDIGSYNNIIFTSRSAVKYGFPLLKKNNFKENFNGEILAIGPATAAELIKRDVHPLISDTTSSEGLVNKINKNDSKSILFCGTNSQGYLKNNLSNLDEIQCYELVFKTIKSEFFNTDREIILVYNLKTLEHILESANDDVLDSKEFVLASKRILDLVRSVKKLKVHIAKDATDHSMIEAAKAII